MIDPFIPVAKDLWKKHGMEPVYWIGFTDPNSEEIVSKELPGVPFQSYYDAWRGTFCEEIEERAKNIHINIDELNSLSRFQLQAYTMMNRLDINRYSFNLIEREQHFLNLYKRWCACLDLFKPDVVLSAVVPHRTYDYVLYLVCQIRGIKFYSFNNTLSLEWSFILPSIYSVEDFFSETYEKYKKQIISVEDLATDLQNQYNRVSSKNYDDAVPLYMNRHNKNDKADRNIFKLFSRFYKKYGRNLFTGKISVNMYKKPNLNWEESEFTALQLYKLNRKNVQYKDSLRKYYDTLCTNLNEKDKYILVSFHYQPEATSCPVGDIYVNQQLIVETILNNTPDDVYVYIKEHPQQFQSHMNGHTCRIKAFYEELAKCSRVKFMPLNLDSFYLMKNALAVATISGTVGWEAAVHKKPVLIFGLAWYEGMEGVLRITDSGSAKKIMDFIHEYKYNENNILAYLMALQEKSINSYHYTSIVARQHIAEEVCVNNLVEALSVQLKP